MTAMTLPHSHKTPEASIRLLKTLGYDRDEIIAAVAMHHKLSEKTATRLVDTTEAC